MVPTQFHFLVVVDFSMMRRIVRSLLKELGCFNVDEAADDAIALHKLRSSDHFDFVITDWNMLTLDGPALLHEIRTDPSLAHLPVLMIIPDPGMHSVPSLCGASGYIAKPFTAATLSEKICGILKKTDTGRSSPVG
jgi:two-component system chemotaxis response regulator CheY